MKRRLTPEMIAVLRTQAEERARTFGADLESPLTAIWEWRDGWLHPGAVVALLDALETSEAEIQGLKDALHSATDMALWAQARAAQAGAKPVDQMTAGDFEAMAYGRGR